VKIRIIVFIDLGGDFKFFEAHRIDSKLLQVQSFIKALQLIETTVINPSLSVKFAQTCVASVRNEPFI
jgi:hypothetical protein